MAKNNQASKSAAAAAARKQAQAQVRAKERRTAVVVSVVSVVAIAAVAFIVWFIVQQSNVPALDSEDAVLPAGSDVTGGIPVGIDGVAGGEVPADVPRVDIYEDFMCPVCGRFEDTNSQDIDELREAGEIAVYYHPISILDHTSSGTKYSTRAAAAAGQVADSAPEYFLDFAHAMYANQPTEGGGGLTDEEIEAIALEVGIPADIASTLDDGKFTKWVIAATEQASVDGMRGTPTVMIDREVLQQEEVPYMNAGVLREYLEGL